LKVTNRNHVASRLRISGAIPLPHTYINDVVKVKVKVKVKGETIPVQAWTGPEGSWKSKPPNFKTIGV